MNNTDNVGTHNNDVAMLLDLNCATVYCLLKKYEIHTHDGRRWSFGTVSDWSKRLPELNENQIRRALRLLEKEGLVIIGNYNRSAWDKTKWYSTNPIPKSMRL